MPLEQKGDYGENPHISEDYYVATLADDITHYQQNDADEFRLVLRFTIEHDGQEVELPFFTPAKLSVSTEHQSSRLAENLQNIGLLEPVLQVLDCRDEILSENHKWYAATEEEVEDLKAALRSVLVDKEIRVLVEDDRDGEASQVGKLQKVFEEDA